MTGQRIDERYLDKLKDFFMEHSLEDFDVIYKNEKKFAEWLDVPTFKFVNSGTSALFLILASGSYKKIWGPSFTHISWINCCEWLKISYDFIDVREETLSLDPKKLQEKIEKFGPPDALVMIDMGGYVGEDTLEVKEICEKYEIIMIEDAAHAFGQSYKGHKAGTIGDYAFFSFSNPKLLTCGEGGAIVCNFCDCNVILEEYIYQGGWYRYNKVGRRLGLNFIMSNWMTELLSMQLDNIDTLQKNHCFYMSKYDAKCNNKIIKFESDLEVPAPSFFAYQTDTPINKKLVDKIPSVIYERYTNVGGDGYPVSQHLQDTLLYWKI